MANEIRARANLVSGTLSVALASGDTTMSSAGLANLPAITSANHAVIVIENEIIYVTAHTASATTATILRAQEGTAAAAHAQNVAWVHGPVVSDYDSVLGRSTSTASVAAYSAETTMFTVAVTVPYSVHLIRVTWHDPNATHTVNGDVFEWRIKEDGTQIASQFIQIPGSGDTRGPGTVISLSTPAAGAHTYTATAVRTSGTGTEALTRSATSPGFLLVEDLGPAL